MGGMKESMRLFMDSLQVIRACSHNHGEELRKHTLSMDLRTHLGNGLTLLLRSMTLEIQNMLDQMSSISSVRTLDKLQLTEEKLLHNTTLSQANQDKQLILSQ